MVCAAVRYYTTAGCSGAMMIRCCGGTALSVTLRYQQQSRQAWSILTRGSGRALSSSALTSIGQVPLLIVRPATNLWPQTTTMATTTMTIRRCNHTGRNEANQVTNQGKVVDNNNNSATRNKVTIGINKELIQLGRNRQWKEILSLYEQRKDNFNQINFATALSQLGRIRSTRRSDPILSELLKDLDRKLQENGFEWMSVRQVSNILHSIAKMKLNRNDSAASIFQGLQNPETAQWLLQEGNPHDVANTVWACAALGVKSANLFAELEKNAPWLVQEGCAQEVANCVWACATLGVSSPTLFAELEKNALWIVQKGTPQAVANSVWACATLRVNSPTLFAQLDQNASWLVQEGNSQNVVNSVWACATLGVAAPNLFAELENSAAWLVQKGTPQAIANSVWACATLGVSSPKIFAELERNAPWILREGNSQDVAISVWACATLRVASPTLFAELERNALRFVREGNPQNVANSVWACATLGFAAPNLFAELENNTAWLVQKGTPQTIANSVWACAKLGVPSPNLFAELEQNALWLMQEGSPQEVANSVWACAALGVKSPTLFAELEKRTSWLIQRGDPQAVANIVWACATLGGSAPMLFAELERNASWIVHEGNPQDIANTCWALAVAGFHEQGRKVLLVRLWQCLMEMNVLCFSEMELRQIHYVETAARAVGVVLREPPDELRSKLGQLKYQTRISEAQNEMSRQLHALGFVHELEVSPFENAPSMMAIDMACKDRMVAIEYDGPSHFLKGTDFVELSIENGPTKAKRRLLQKLGWTVVNLDWKEARRHQTSNNWLKSKLADGGIKL